MTESPGKVFNGYLEGITLADIVQLACLERYERKLEVRGDNFHGVIYFARGEVVHAETGTISGQKAFIEIMCCPGGTFTFTPGQTNEKTIHESWNFLLMEAMRFIDEQSDTLSLSSQIKPLNVLVVDDSKIFTKALVKLFDEELGARIAGKASNVEEALQFLERENPDLVTLDVNLSVESGTMPLKHIMIRTPVPVVLMSSFNERNFPTMMEYLCLGAVDLVEKPNDAETWNIVSKRLRRLTEKIKEIRLKNIKRTRPPAMADYKMPLGGPAKKLFIVLGGVGSLIELQKMLGCINSNESSASLVFLDLYPGVTPQLVKYFEKMTVLNPMPLRSGFPMLASQCGITYWHGSWEITAEGGFAVPTMKMESGLLDASKLLSSAAEVFGSNLAVVILSGTDLHINDGLQKVAQKGGKIFLQDPDSCLAPEPIIQFESLNLHTSYFESDRVMEILGDFLS
ncbi:MAG: response regulator [Desulfobulbaceae bacterium]|nr:response regulator [Desulfobulbaceae bacterium]